MKHYFQHYFTEITLFIVRINNVRAAPLMVSHRYFLPKILIKKSGR